jgi:microcystin-dependent protein
MSRLTAKTLALALAGALAAPPLLACPDSYSDAYIGSVCILASTYCPDGYAEANGQRLNIRGNEALFSLLGCTYGGDCTAMFALPDLRSRAPVHIGQGPGLNRIDQGQMGGAETVILTSSQLPGTTATVSATDIVIETALNSHGAKDSDGASVMASQVSVAQSGGNQPVSIRDPYLGVRYCIALRGIYPSRPW